MFQRKILTKPVRSVSSVSTRVKFFSPTFSFQPCANASPWPSFGTHAAFRATYCFLVALSVSVSVASS